MESDDEHVFFRFLKDVGTFLCFIVLLVPWGGLRLLAIGSMYVESSDLSNIDTSREL